MTREEAVKVLKRMIKTGIAYDDGYAFEPLTEDEEMACSMAIKALEQKPILDKIRAELHATAEAIPKDEYEARLKENNELINDLEELRTMINKFAESYENRLKADLKAILVELQLEIEEMSGLCTEIHGDEWNEINTVHSQDVLSLIQQKINALKAESEGKE